VTGEGRPAPALRLHRAKDLAALADGEPFDFVVVGGGGAGAAAAIEANDRGASVLVVEKMATAGGSTEVSGGSLRLVVDAEAAKEHLEHLSGGTTPREVIDAFVEALVALPEWVRAHGGELDPWNDEGVLGRFFPVGGPPQYRHLPLTYSIDARAHVRPERPGRSGGAALWDFLARNLAEREVPVALGARATRLVQAFPERAVTGVEAAVPGGSVHLAAKVAVLLCCGGFSQDAALKLQYFGVDVPAASPPGRATGDGIHMAQDVGADLWHMTAPAGNLGFSAPGLDPALRLQMPDFGFVMVDQLGRRYSCETSLEAHSAARAMMAPDQHHATFVRAPSYLVFDATTLAAGRIGSAGPAHRWSEDNADEVGRGWIRRAEDLATLAGLLGLPAGELQQSVTEYNRAAASGTVDPFGRTPETMRPISGPPFYAMAVSPTLVNTQGGPRRDARGRIVRPDGSPIPGLYGAGELGSIWNRMYPSGGNLAEAMVSGPMAVRHALAAN